MQNKVLYVLSEKSSTYTVYTGFRISEDNLQILLKRSASKMPLSQGSLYHQFDVLPCLENAINRD